jgi:hypothetical protein
MLILLDCGTCFFCRKILMGCNPGYMFETVRGLCKNEEEKDEKKELDPKID